MGFFGRFVDKFKKGLQKTRDILFAPIRKLVEVFRNIKDEDIDVIEEALIGADVGVEATDKIIERLRIAYKKGDVKTTDQLIPWLKADLKQRLVERGNELRHAPSPPTVILVCGVNGTGKTTSIAKLTKILTDEGKKVILAASDTFRAAAVDQLTIWAQRLKVDIVKHQMGPIPRPSSSTRRMPPSRARPTTSSSIPPAGSRRKRT